MIQEFPNKGIALNFMRGKWCKLVSNDTAGQKSDTYYCAEHGKTCSARAKLVYRKNEEFVVRYYEADAEYHSQRCDNGLPYTVSSYEGRTARYM